MQMKTMIRRIWNEEEGQALTEYGLILGLVSIASVATLTLMGPKISDLIATITDALP